MYETRIIIPSRRGQGLADIAVEDRKSTSKDKAMSMSVNVVVVVVILAFLYIAVEPFLGGGESYSAFEETASEMAGSIRFYVAGNQEQPSYDLAEIDDVPLDAWDNIFLYDSFWERIISMGPDGKLNTVVPDIPVVIDGQGNDDMIYYCNSYGSLWYSFKGPDGDAIGVMRADGTNNLTLSVSTESKRNLRYPVLSPDGKVLTFSVLSAGKEWQIATSSPDGTDVSFVPAIGDSRWPCWDSSGSALFYESKRAGDDGILAHSIFSYNFDSDSETKILSGRGSFRSPVQHPYHEDLYAYVHIRKGRKLPRICFMNSDAGDFRDYISSGRVPQKSPSWFPDGMELAYVARVDSRLQAFTMTTSEREAIPIDGVTGDPQYIACAPLGRRVALVIKEGGMYKVLIIDLDTGSKVKVFQTRNKFYSISWST